MQKHLNQFWSSSTQIVHTGGIVRSERIRDSFDMAREICRLAEEHIGKVDYDLAYAGSREQLIITEIFGGMGGVMLRTADWNFNLRMLEAAAPGNRVFDIEGALPKYTGVSLPLPSLKECVFLPGSNLLDKQVVSLDVLKFLARNQVWCKPHPLTHRVDKHRLKAMFGSNMLMDMDNAIEAIKSCESVYVTTNSELGLYATLMDKNVYILDSPDQSSAYGHFYRHLDKLADLVTTAASGVFMPGEDIEKQFQVWLNHYRSIE